MTRTELGVSPSQLRWLGACQSQLHQRHWLNGSACDTCHKVLNVCSFQRDGWASAAAGGRMTFCVTRRGGGGGGGGTCCGSALPASSGCQLQFPLSQSEQGQIKLVVVKRTSDQAAEWRVSWNMVTESCRRWCVTAHTDTHTLGLPSL